MCRTYRQYFRMLKLYLSFLFDTASLRRKTWYWTANELNESLSQAKRVRTEKLAGGWKCSWKRGEIFFFPLSSFLPVTSARPCKHPSATWQPFRKKVWPKARYLACGQSFRRRLVSSPRHSLSSSTLPHTYFRVSSLFFRRQTEGRIETNNGWSFRPLREIDTRRYNLPAIYI